MKITLIPSAFSPDGAGANQYLTSYAVNGTVAIDAGSIGFHQGPHEQAAIQHIFLTHSHFDHLASLPIFLANVAGLRKTPVVLHASEAVQQSLRSDIFNGRLWPNFLELRHDGTPFVVLQGIESGQSVEVEGLRLTAVAVNHVVPTLGFIIEDRSATVVIPSDTSATEEIWQRANQTPNVKGVFLEATFPDEMAALAEVTHHLTPAGFVREMQKLAGHPPFYAVHLKAGLREQVERELLAYRLPNLEIAKFGLAYEF